MFSTLFSRGAGLIGRKAREKFFETRGGHVKELRAREILGIERVRNLLSPKLKPLLEIDLLKDELEIKTIRILVSELANERTLKELAVERDATLFALLVLELMETGIGNYCEN